MALQITAPDLNVIKGIRGYSDFQKEAQAQGLQSALAAAQIAQAMNKGKEFNLEESAQKALLKTNMGYELSPEEQGALKSYDQMNQSKLTYTQLPSGEYVARPAANSILQPKSVDIGSFGADKIAEYKRMRGIK
jgi:hypothetical protein